MMAPGPYTNNNFLFIYPDFHILTVYISEILQKVYKRSEMYIQLFTVNNNRCSRTRNHQN